MTTTLCPDVRECPHCGNPGTRDPRHTFHWNHMQRLVSVCCGQCGATGPFARLVRSGAKAEDEALRLWNERKTRPTLEFRRGRRPSR